MKGYKKLPKMVLFRQNKPISSFATYGKNCLSEGFTECYKPPMEGNPSKRFFREPSDKNQIFSDKNLT